MIDLSIIIVNWNAREYLLQCLESIFQTEEIPAEEIIVIDNGSEDGSAAEVRRRFSHCQMISNEKNLGFAKATNQGLRASRGRYLLLLNPDTVVKRGALQRFILFMDRHPEAGIAGAQLLNPDGSRQNSIANFPSLATELLNKSLLRFFFPERFPGKEKNYPEPIEVDSVIGAAMMVRREALEQVGGLDEDYFLFFEETDWCYRIRKGGWAIYHVPHVEICHFQGKSAETRKERAKIEYFRSRYQFFRKHRGRFEWTLLLAGVLIKLSVELLSLFVGSLATLFRVRKLRKKLWICLYLLWWHVKLCPDGMGLKEVR